MKIQDFTRQAIQCGFLINSVGTYKSEVAIIINIQSISIFDITLYDFLWHLK